MVEEFYECLVLLFTAFSVLYLLMVLERMQCTSVSIAAVVLLLSCVRLFVTPCTIVHQTPLSMGFPRQEYWSGLPFPSPGIFLTQELIHVFCFAGRFFTTAPPGDLSMPTFMPISISSTQYAVSILYLFICIYRYVYIHTHPNPNPILSFYIFSSILYIFVCVYIYIYVYVCVCVCVCVCIYIYIYI